MSLTLSWWRPLSYRNQSIDLLRKPMDLFRYHNGLRHEKVNGLITKLSWLTRNTLEIYSKYNCLLSNLLTDKMISSKRITVVNGKTSHKMMKMQNYFLYFFRIGLENLNIIDHMNIVFLANSILHPIWELLSRWIYHSRDDHDNDHNNKELPCAMIGQGTWVSLISFRNYCWKDSPL